MQEMENAASTDMNADRQADWISYRFVALFVCLSWITLSASDQIDAIKNATGEPAIQFWLTQFTSHLVIMVVALLVPWLLTRFQMTRETWPRSLAAFGLGFVVFGVVHILAMVALRKLLWPVIIGEHYEFGLAAPLNWVYELQKDLYTFALLISIFWFGRYSARQHLEAKGRQEEVRESGRLTLTSGGRIYLLHADDIRLAKAAANYVEIDMPNRTLLVRMTLRELELLLMAAGDDHIRIHRSCMVHKSNIAELIPNGDGSASLLLIGGQTVQVSRSYRSALTSALSN
ncbi:MAG: LytTR family DNA-binding domain-containing protein [Hyphomonadaceae bacterium]